MRIVRWSGLPAVVLVKGRGMCAVAVPENLASREVLELARLVLSPNEYQELQLEVRPAEGEDPEALRLVRGGLITHLQHHRLTSGASAGREVKGDHACWS